MTFVLPDDTNRLAVVGMTGSGKTHAGLWHFSLRSWDRFPWIIVDYKRDENIAKIPGLIEIDVARAPPRKAGIYVVRPIPTPEDTDRLTDFLWAVWANEYTGLYIDEGYMIGRFNPALTAVLTQGRSKRIPVIMLSQRPAYVSPFFLSESEFLQMYHLHNPADVKRMREWIPYDGPQPGEYQSIYFDVKRREVTELAPMPPMSVILDRMKARQPKVRPWI